MGIQLPSIAVLAVLAACTGDHGGDNPPTLWFAMSPSRTDLVLVGEEPHPY